MREPRLVRRGWRSLLGVDSGWRLREFLAVAGLLCLSLLPGLLQGRTYYVDSSDPAARNENPGTETLPWATIHRANQKVMAGDTVVVKAGIYHDWICPEHNGTASEWIVYRSEPPHEAILDGWVPLDSVAVDTSQWRHVQPDTGNIWYRKLVSSAFTEAWMDTLRLPYPYPYTCDPLRFAPGRSYVDSTGTLFVWLPRGEKPVGHDWHVTLKNGVWLLTKSDLSAQRYVEVSGFVARNFGLNGISVTSSYVRVLNNVAFKNGRAGIAVAFCNHVLVEGNEAFENCTGIGFSQGITAYHVLGKDIVFRGNISHDNYDGADSLHCGTDGSGIVVDTCPPEAGALLVNNVAYNNAGAGFGVFQSSNVSLINNTSFNNFLKDPSWNDECHIVGTAEMPSNHVVLRNNILVGAQPEAPVLHISYSAVNPPEEVLLDHNLYCVRNGSEDSELFEVTLHVAGEEKHWALTLADFQSFSLTVDSVLFDPHWGVGSLVADPLFSDWRGADFSLRDGSPAIDSGNPELAPTTDIVGTPRPQGAGFDLGAYEFVPVTSVTGKSGESSVSVAVYPNPFNDCLRLEYRLLHPVRVRVRIFNILGQEETRLVDARLPAGTYHVFWHATDAAGKALPSGLYVLRFETGETTLTRKVLLLR